MTIFRPPKIQETQEFYQNLAQNDRYQEHIWGKSQRFNSEKSVTSISIEKYFTQKIDRLIQPTDKVIDIGCGSGLFLPMISQRCRELVGVDISPEFLRDSRETIDRFGLSNTRVLLAKSEELPFPDNEFDVLLMVDAIHHIYHLSETVLEMKRVLKPGGKLIIFEPNILNPALFLMCLFDRNEWGAVGLGRKSAYRHLFQPFFNIDAIEYNGLLIGPDSPINLKIADFLNYPTFSTFVGWLNPKIFISMTH
ncbi:class I SAM-dependent methyltransferase [Oscillatoriales cyanobacterium LEGE 11467]|uniref:Class I SAM-dependent methyltransferase n=1 Tax=Zarconia navalis LEGE 11467 TaxID=1828826 RepID=A0A928VXE2_9CYAN|nr:class I SAM-dependent methyltransferase [Zarconia navalis]MBE9041886.1 class I SAM-dependent methyltransferase [Zarconia navalis LEGE 11467]